MLLGCRGFKTLNPIFLNPKLPNSNYTLQVSGISLVFAFRRVSTKNFGNRVLLRVPLKGSREVATTVLYSKGSMM